MVLVTAGLELEISKTNPNATFQAARFVRRAALRRRAGCDLGNSVLPTPEA